MLHTSASEIRLPSVALPTVTHVKHNVTIILGDDFSEPETYECDSAPFGDKGEWVLKLSLKSCPPPNAPHSGTTCPTVNVNLTRVTPDLPPRHIVSTRKLSYSFGGVDVLCQAHRPHDAKTNRFEFALGPGYGIRGAPPYHNLSVHITGAWPRKCSIEVEFDVEESISRGPASSRRLFQSNISGFVASPHFGDFGTGPFQFGSPASTSSEDRRAAMMREAFRPRRR